MGLSYGPLVVPPVPLDAAAPELRTQRGPVSAFSAITEPLMEFVGAGSWTSCRRVVEQHTEVLLSPEASAVLDQMLEMADDPRVRADLEGHRRLLEQARHFGLERAFDEAPGSPGGEIFQARDRVVAVLDFVNAESWEETREILEDRRDLLFDEDTDGVFVQLIRINESDPDLVETLEEHRDLLAACQHDGISRAFEDLLGGRGT